MCMYGNIQMTEFKKKIRTYYLFHYDNILYNIVSRLFMFRYDYVYVRSVLVKNKVKLLESVLKFVGQPTPRPLPSPIFLT